jgi:hypothetical protein
MRPACDSLYDQGEAVGKPATRPSVLAFEKTIRISKYSLRERGE